MDTDEFLQLIEIYVLVFYRLGLFRWHGMEMQLKLAEEA